jgi:uncharacterized delta-60 repeat protein
MKKKRTAQSAFANLCIFLGVSVFFGGLLLALFASANPQPFARQGASRAGEQVHGANEVSVAPAGGVYPAWIASYNGPGNYIDEATAIAVDTLGNVYVTGQSFGVGVDFDYATVKYNADGQQQWAARYNGPVNFDDHATAIAVDSSGNVYVTGRSPGIDTGDDYVTIKYNSSGQQQWLARYNGPGSDGNLTDAAWAIAVDDSGNVYVTGQSVGAGTDDDYVTIKYNPDGQEQWVARYNGPENLGDAAYAIAVDTSGNVYVTGVSTGSGTDVDYATIKYDSSGQEQWVARYNGPVNGLDTAYAIAVDSSGNVYVTGESRGPGIEFDYATIKYDSAGQQQWVARYHGPGTGGDSASAIAVDGSGNVYVTGQSNGVGTQSDYATIKYDSTGQQQWVARYNGPGNSGDEAHAIAVDSSGNVYITGQSYGAGTELDYATVKYDSAGQEEWVIRYNGEGKSFDIANAIAVDGSGNVYVTGEGDVDYTTIKYVQGPTPTPTASPTPTATASLTPTPTFTPTPSPTASPTVTPTPSDFGGTPTATPTATPAATSTPSATPTPTATATATPTPTASPTVRPTPVPRRRPSPRPRP